jgi:hypothetical protein
MTISFKKGKSTVRRSIRRPEVEDQDEPKVALTDTNEILCKVFDLFEQKLNKTKQVCNHKISKLIKNVQKLNNLTNNQEIHKDLFSSIYDNTFQYFNFYYNKRVLCSSANLNSERTVFNPICNVIPTIALYTGINSQDYAYLCDNLNKELKDTWSRNLFIINEKNSSNIKNLANSIFAQWESITVSF